MGLGIEARRHHLEIAYEVASTSVDQSTQNGAVLIAADGETIGTGCNAIHWSVRYAPERHERPLKYKYTEHAERAAIYSAVRYGHAALVPGSTLVACWAACCDCARAIIGCGIRRLVTHKQAYDRTPAHWKEDVNLALEMLGEAGVEIEWYDGVVGVQRELRHSGQLWRP